MTAQDLNQILAQLQKELATNEFDSLATKYKYDGAIEIVEKLIAGFPTTEPASQDASEQ